MQPLSVIVDSASKNFRLDPSHCSLQLNKKQLDLSTPFRIANLPTGAKLTLISRQRPQPQQSRDSSDSQGNANWQLPNSSLQHLQDQQKASQQQLQHQQQSDNISRVTQELQSNQSTDSLVHQQYQVPNDQGQKKFSSDLNSLQQSAEQQQPPQEESASTSKVDGASSSNDNVQLHQDQQLQHQRKNNLNDFQFFVYTDKELYLYRTIQQQITQLNYKQNDNQDDFYEFNQQDFRQIQQAKKLRENQNSGLKTQKIRDLEDENKAKQYKTAVIRLLLPDHVVIEIRMNPLDKVATLVKIARQSVHEYLLEDFYLFTTPPKQVIDAQQENRTLWKAGFVPAANVRVGFKSLDQQAMGQVPNMEIMPPYITTEVMDRIGIEPPEMQNIDPQQREALLKQGEQNLQQQRKLSQQASQSLFNRASQQQAAQQYQSQNQGLHNLHGFDSNQNITSNKQQSYNQQQQQQQPSNNNQQDDWQDDEEQSIGDQLKQGFKNVGDKIPKWFKLGKK